MKPLLVQFPGWNCYHAIANNSPSSGIAIMKFGCTLDLSGLSTALAVEQAGAWHLFDPDTTPRPTDEEVREVYEEILSFDAPHKLPSDPGLLRLLVDAAAALHGEETRAIGWRILGIAPNKGRSLLQPEELQISWAIWHTAVNFGLGFSRFEHPDEYFGRS